MDNWSVSYSDKILRASSLDIRGELEREDLPDMDPDREERPDIDLERDMDPDLGDPCLEERREEFVGLNLFFNCFHVFWVSIKLSGEVLMESDIWLLWFDRDIIL